MIQFFRGPGGGWKRFFGEFVPFLVGCFAWGVLLGVIGALWAIPVALGVWALASIVVVWLRAHPLRRRLYRVALFAHVVFWSFQGAQEAPIRGPGALNEAGRTRVEAWLPFKAGVGEAAFELKGGDPLGGWGTRDRRAGWPPLAGLGPVGRFGQRWQAGWGSAGVQRRLMATGVVGEETLGARALWLEPEGAPPLVFVRLDVVAVDRHVVDQVAAELRAFGVRPEGLLIAATHTHTGPGGHLRAPLAALVGSDHHETRMADHLVRACLAAIDAARTRAIPAGMRIATGADRDAGGERLLARNRRHAADDIDDRVYELTIHDRAGRVIASLLNYAVHPTVFRPRHRTFTRDLVGAVEDARGQALDAPCLFFNGAQGDIAPASLPLEGRALADALAVRFVAALPAPETDPGSLGTRMRYRAARMRIDLGEAAAVAALGDRAALHRALTPGVFGARARDTAAGLLALPVNALLWSLTLTDLRVGFTFEGQVGVIASLRHATDNRAQHVGAIGIELQRDDGGVERLLILWQPFEATQAVGRAWRERAGQAGWPRCALFGLCNDAHAYLVGPAQYAEGGYEANASLYGPDAFAEVDRAFVRALERIGDD